MDIKWYKNYWYWVAVIIALIIVFLAVFSQKQYAVGLITADGVYRMFSVETFYRSIFNPLWVVALWCFEKGQKLNSEHHKDILKYLKGVVVGAQDCGNKNILTSTLAGVLINSGDIESRIKKTLDSGVNIKKAGGNPTI